MATTADLKRLRELLPENGKDTPDEFIGEVLESCGFDLTKAYEELQERLSRSSWESVEKGKKKKSDKPQDGQGPTMGRRRAPTGFGKGDSSRNGGSWENRDNRENFSSNRGKGGMVGQGRGQANGMGSVKSGTKAGSADTSALNRPSGTEGQQTKTPAAPLQERKPAEPAPVPPAPQSNQWAKGRPQVIPPKPKATPVQVQSVPEPNPPTQQVQVETVLADESSANILIASDSASLGSTEPSEHNQATSDFVDGNDENGSVDNTSQHHELPASESYQEEPSNQCSVVEHNHESASFPEADAIRNDFEQFSVSSTMPSSDAPVSQQSPGFGSTGESLPTSQHTLAQVEGQGYSQAAYAQYSGYQQNYQNMPQQQQQQYDGARDSQAAFNAGKMYYTGTGETGYLAGAAAPPIRSAYPGKGGYGQKAQHAGQHAQQQGGWQAPVMNSYGMMGNSMYPMTPQQAQQLQMMYMQTYGMGMPYGAMNGAMLNNNAGYGQQHFAASKSAFHQQSSNKKHQQYGGGFGAGPYDSLPYPQAVSSSEDYFKAQGPATGSYDNTFGYPYGGGMNFDGSAYQSSQQLAAPGYTNGNGRCSTQPAGNNGCMASEEAQYSHRRPYFGQPELAQGGQWTGGN